MAPERYHGLDALRGGAMLMGLVLHAGFLYFSPEVYPTVLPELPTEVPEVQAWLLVLTAWIHIWRMPLFFLLAGFFAAMMIARRGLAAVAQDRALRILGALIVFSLLFSVLFGRPFGAIDHLWFLWYLSLSLGLLMALEALTRGAWMAPLDPFLRRPAGLLWLLLPLALLVSFGRTDALWHKIPETIWEAPTPSLPMYGAYVLVGALLYRHRGHIAMLRTSWVHWALLAGATATFGVTLLLEEVANERLAPLGWVTSAATTLGYSLGFIGLAERALDRARPWVTQLMVWSYPVYVLHLYPTLLLSALMIWAGLPQALTVPLAALGGFGGALGLYLLLVKYTPLNWVLAGYRKSWFRWPWQPNGFVRPAHG